MRFEIKKMLAVGTYTVKITSYTVLDADTDKERILINSSSAEGQAPLISYGYGAGYEMLSQVCNAYGITALDDLVGKDVIISVDQKGEYLNARILTRAPKAERKEKAEF